ncbi:MAG: hypothetical protein Q8M92_01820 [Candidatus Subteraquimicrobiales bacterium]|nr:hypothetical protein [Candidatus Subteraquimicrobiales bacterium]
MGKNYLEELRKIASEHPKKRVRLIIKTSVPASEAVSYLKKNKGIKINYQYSIVRAVALETSASKALEIGEKDWVVTVEEDREVKALRRQE